MLLIKVVALHGESTASCISEYSHKDMPYLTTNDGEEILYNLVFYREYPYSVRIYNEKD